MRPSSSEQPRGGGRRGRWLALPAVLVLGAFGYLAWDLRRPAPAVVAPGAPATTPPPRRGAGPRPASAPTASAPASAPSPPAADADAGPGAAPPDDVRAARQRVREAQTALLKAVQPCLEHVSPEVRPPRRVRLSYRLSVRAGRGRALDPQVVGAGDPALERCFVGRIRDAEWPAAGPDGELPTTEGLSLKQLGRLNPTE